MIPVAINAAYAIQVISLREKAVLHVASRTASTAMGTSLSFALSVCPGFFFLRIRASPAPTLTAPVAHPLESAPSVTRAISLSPEPPAPLALGNLTASLVPLRATPAILARLTFTPAAPAA